MEPGSGQGVASTTKTRERSAPMSRVTGAERSIQDVAHDQQGPRGGGWNWWYLLFIIQFVAVLWPPFYNKADPSFIGVPLFYWYQLLWVILSAILTAIVYFVTEE